MLLFFSQFVDSLQLDVSKLQLDVSKLQLDVSKLQLTAQCRAVVFSQFIDSLQLDVSKLQLDVEHDKRLPAPLMEKCAQLSVKTSAVSDLRAAMQSTSDVKLVLDDERRRKCRHDVASRFFS